MFISYLQKSVQILILLAFVNFTYAQNYSRDNFPRDNFPTGNEVLEKVKGDNEKETILKQISVFDFLSSEINRVLQFRNYSQREKMLVDGYGRVSLILKNKYDKEIASLNDRYNKNEYYDALNSKIWEAEIFAINNLFDENTKKYYDAELQKATEYNIAEQKQQQKTESEKHNFSFDGSIFLLIVGLIFLFGIPIVILSFRDRRKFNRTNQYGAQEYDSYGQAFSENLFQKFLGFLALISVLIGIGILYSAFT